MPISTFLLEIRIEAPPGQSWPGLGELTRVWNEELSATGQGRFLQAGRKSQANCATEADVVMFELLGEFNPLLEVLSDRLRQFQVPESTTFSLLERSREGQPVGAERLYAARHVHADPLLVPWGWLDQAMMAVVLTELHQEPRWRELARRLEAPLPRFVLMGMGGIDAAALTAEERQAFLAAAERSCQAKANEGPIGWTKPEQFPDWVRRFRQHLERWRKQGEPGA